MGLPKDSKLKELISLATNHGLLTSSFLEARGFSRQLRYKYKQSGWLAESARGVYVLPGSKLDWLDVVRALQKQLNLKLHLGAKTVFSLKGKTHYPASNTIYIYYRSETHIPKWLAALECFPKNSLRLKRNNPISNWELGLTTHEDIQISSLERAMIEQLDLIGTAETFDESFKLFESLSTLRPKLVQTLLENCTSIKAKRLFLLLAEHLNYGWFEKLDLKRIELGSGPRQIVSGGQYNAKYQLVVPDLNRL
jgi:hypothetical protein